MDTCEYMVRMYCRDLDSEYLPPKDHVFEVTIETNTKLMQRAVNKVLSQYKDEKRGPTVILVQSANLGRCEGGK